MKKMIWLFLSGLLITSGCCSSDARSAPRFTALHEFDLSVYDGSEVVLPNQIRVQVAGQDNANAEGASSLLMIFKTSSGRQFELTVSRQSYVYSNTEARKYVLVLCVRPNDFGLQVVDFTKETPVVLDMLQAEELKHGVFVPHATCEGLVVGIQFRRDEHGLDNSRYVILQAREPGRMVSTEWYAPIWVQYVNK